MYEKTKRLKNVLFASLCICGVAVNAQSYLSDVSWEEVDVKDKQKSAGFIDVFDVNGDGFEEILFSTLQEEGGSPGSPPKGALRLMSNATQQMGDAWQEEILIPLSENLGFINAPHFLDIDQDGIKDIIVHQGFLTTSGGSYFWLKGPDFSEIRTVAPETASSDYFWHETVQLDLDKDGLLDLLSTSANTDVEPAAKRIEWYRNMGDGTFEQHIIDDAHGGVFIKTYDLDRDGDQDIVVSQFFGPPAEPSLVWLENVAPPSPENYWKGTWITHHIDTSTGLGYHFEFYDIDVDGQDELVYANHNNLNNKDIVDENGNSIPSGMYWFEIPDRPQGVSAWEKHVISEGFPVNTFDFGNPDSQGSPGIFSIGDLDRNGLPDIVLPGDGTQDLFFLQQKVDRTFERSVIAQGKMFGMTKITDVDGDGSLEVVGAMHNFPNNTLEALFNFPLGNLKIYKPSIGNRNTAPVAAKTVLYPNPANGQGN